MNYISAEKEIELLRYLKRHEVLGSGGARIVYEANDFIKELLGLDMELNYVVKVAMGRGGMSQNQAEVDTFIEYGSRYLATIFMAGRYCNIMEAVEPDDYSDLADEIYDFDTRYEGADDYAECYDLSLTDNDNQAVDTIGFLADVFGHTSDNGQVGWTKDHRCVAYDYGFYAANGCDNQTSPLRDMVYNDDTMNTYFCGLIRILFEEKELIKSLDNVDYSLSALEKEIIDDYYNCDDDDEEEESDC